MFLHTFTGEHVPPNLGRRLLPAPLGSIFTINLIADFFRWWYRVPHRWQFKGPYIRFRTFMHNVRIATGKFLLLKWLLKIIGYCAKKIWMKIWYFEIVFRHLSKYVISQSSKYESTFQSIE